MKEGHMKFKRSRPDRPMAASLLLSGAIQISLLLATVVAPRPLTVRAKTGDEVRRFIKIDIKKDQRLKERVRSEAEQVRSKPCREKRPTVREERELPDEEPEVASRIVTGKQDSGDPLKKAVVQPDKLEEFRPLRSARAGAEAKRDSKLARETRKRGVMAVLDKSMKRNTSLTRLMGKNQGLRARNVVWGEDGRYALTDDGENDLAYMGNSGDTGDWGGGGRMGRAGGTGLPRGGFGVAGAFGLPGMGGPGGGLPDGIGGGIPDKRGRMVLVGIDGPERKRPAVVDFPTGSAGVFCKEADVRRKVKGRAAAIRACYEMQLQMKPQLRGKVTLQWIVDLSGKVKGVKVARNTTGSDKLASCVSKVIGKVRFRAPVRGICVIRWPFVFNSGR